MQESELGLVQLEQLAMTDNEFVKNMVLIGRLCSRQGTGGISTRGLGANDMDSPDDYDVEVFLPIGPAEATEEPYIRFRKTSNPKHYWEDSLHVDLDVSLHPDGKMQLRYDPEGISQQEPTIQPLDPDGYAYFEGHTDHLDHNVSETLGKITSRALETFQRALE